MRVIILALVAAMAFAVYNPAAPTGAEIIPGEYIVVLRPEAAMATHMSRFSSLVNSTNTMHVYSIGEFQGYAVKMSAEQSLMIQNSEDVKYVEPNMVARALQTCQSYSPPNSWGLARTVIEGRIPPSPPIANIPYQLRTGTAAGRGIEVHVIDTGVYCEHTDFVNGCVMSFDATNEGMFDGNGHGTHVGSSASGRNFGLARESTVVGVKVLGSNGSGTFAGVIAGINWTANAARTGRRIVANMSLGGGFNQAVNDATDASVLAGAVMAVAAGNSNNNACNSSPASAARAYTVMSTDNLDRRSTFSSFGPCCQIFAPGTSITAAWIGGNTRTNTISGTSMASPHIAGIAAKWWSAAPTLNNNQVTAAITAGANNGLVQNIGAGSPNLLGLMNCDTF